MVSGNLVKEVMVTQVDNSKKFGEFPFSDIMIERGLFLTQGEIWKAHRNILSPHFSFENIKGRIWAMH